MNRKPKSTIDRIEEEDKGLLSNAEGYPLPRMLEEMLKSAQEWDRRERNLEAGIDISVMGISIMLRKQQELSKQMLYLSLALCAVAASSLVISLLPLL